VIEITDLNDGLRHWPDDSRAMLEPTIESHRATVTSAGV
jgi:hypothetical protein